MRSRWRAAGAGLFVLTGAAASVACRASAGDPLSAWVTKAGDICKQAQQEADASRPVLFQPSLADTLKKSAELSKDEAQQLRDVDLPGERRAEVRDYLGTLDDRDRELELLASQAAHPTPDFKPPPLDTLADHTQKAADQAKSLGLKECAAGIDLSVAGASTTTTAAPPDTLPGDPDEPAPNPTDLNNQTQDQAG